jgi:hypothetical protein
MPLSVLQPGRCGMERSHEEEETQESSRRGAWQAWWLGAERGQTPRQPRKRPQGWPGQKPQKGNCRPPQCTPSTPRSPQEAIEVVIASIRARFGDEAIGLGDRGIRFAEASGEGVSHARMA